MKRGITIGVVLIACAGALTAAGCGDSDSGGGGDSGDAKQVTIGWTPPDTTGVFKTATSYLERGAKQANANGFDVKVLTRSPASHTDFASQQAIVEDYISKNVDVIVISPADVQAIKPALKQANQADIPVVMVNLLEKQDDVDIASYIGFDNSEAASVSAYSVLDYFGGPGVLGSGKKVDVKPGTFMDLKWWQKLYASEAKDQPKGDGTVVEGIAGTFFSQERVEGFDKVISQYPNMKLLGKPLAADWTREKGVKAAENFASRYSPEQMNFMWAASNEMALGAVQALTRKGSLNTAGPEGPPSKDKTSLFTNDSTQESTDAIRAGKIIAETTHGFPEWGWFGSEFAVKLACDQKVPEKLDIRPRTVWKGNTDDFYPTPKLKKIDWKQIRKDC